MKKMIISMIILILTIVFATGCNTDESLPGSSDFLNDTDWSIEGTGDCVTFVVPNQDKGYYEWNLYDGKHDTDYSGTYSLYIGQDEKVTDFQHKMSECQDNLKQLFDSHTKDLNEAQPLVLIVDIEDPSANPDAETGMKTHFEYYGLCDGETMILCEPMPHNYDSIRVLSKY